MKVLWRRLACELQYIHHVTQVISLLVTTARVNSEV